MSDRDQMIAELRRRDMLDELRASDAEQTATPPDYSTLQDDRQELRIGPIDTGYHPPPEVTEYLSGLGRRLTQIATLGTYDNDSKYGGAGTHPAAEEALDNSGYATAGSITADIAGIPAAGAALKTASSIPTVGKTLYTVGQGLTQPKNIVNSATALGAYGAATSPERLEGGVGGLGGGALGYAVPKVAGSVIKPQLQKGASYLREKGIQLTPGELLGGAIQRVEDGLTSLPLLGDLIRTAKGRSISSWNKTLIEDALKPVGGALDDRMPAGHEAISAANDLVSKAYNDTLKNMNVGIDEPLMSALQQLRVIAKELPRKERKQFIKYLDDTLLPKFADEAGEPRVLLGRTYQELVSGVRTKYDTLLRAKDAYQNDLGNLIRDVHKTLLDAGKRQNPAEYGAKLDAASKSYAMMARINGAAAGQGVKEGIFTPNQLVSEVRKYANTTRNPHKYASGKAFGQRELRAARGVLPPTVPDSGTPLRSWVTGGGALLGAGAVSPAAAMGGAGALGAGASMYTKPGLALADTLIARRPAGAGVARKVADEVSPYAALMGAMLGIQGSQ